MQEWVPDDWEWAEPRLYKVGLGMGYLELPQRKLTYMHVNYIVIILIRICLTMLKSNSVYSLESKQGSSTSFWRRVPIKSIADANQQTGVSLRLYIIKA